MAVPTVSPLKKIVLLSDSEWDLIYPIFERHSRKGGRPAVDLRRSLEGMRWVGSTGSPWRDMPEEYGNWETVKRHYGRLKRRGIIDEVLGRFPLGRLPIEKTSKHDERYDKAHNKALVAKQLECLHHLTTRRRRGSAATTATRK